MSSLFGLSNPVAVGGWAFAAVAVLASSIRHLWLIDSAPRNPVADTRRKRWPNVSSRRIRRQQQRQVPQLATALARSLRSGATIPGALAEASTTEAASSFHTGLAEVLERWDQGHPLGVALQGLVELHPAEGLDLIVRALVLGFDGGGDRAQVLDAVATTLADRLALAEEITALTSQARASAMLITVAPAMLAVVFLTLDPSLLPVVLASPVGRISLIAGAALAVLNWWSMSVIVRRAFR